MIAATPEALERACPVCGAEPGEHCRWGQAMTLAGRQGRAVHFGRVPA